MPSNKQTHTPTPWIARNDGKIPVLIFSPSSDTGIAIIADGLSGGPIDFREVADNAAHIVHCVNSHDANMARIAALEVALRNVILLAEEMRGHIAEACEEPEILTKRCPRIDDARALFAAAKEATP